MQIKLLVKAQLQLLAEKLEILVRKYECADGMNVQGGIGQIKKINARFCIHSSCTPWFEDLPDWLLSSII